MNYQVIIVCILVLIELTYCRPNGNYNLDQSKFHQRMPYRFSYGVKDDYKGTYFNRHEKSSGDNVIGSYSVMLPDGRHQVVKYRADPYHGFRAEVTYHGVAHYPPPSEYQTSFVVKPKVYSEPSNDRKDSHNLDSQPIHIVSNFEES